VGKTREQILSGSTIESMTEIYFRLQRPTINHPATINDLPFEVLRKCLGYLLRRGRLDLIAAISVNRARRPVGQELLRTLALTNQENIEKSLCGLLLKSVVLGFKSLFITSLVVDLMKINAAYIP
jgi:hypothetical protein